MDPASNLVFELVFISISIHHCVRGSIQTVPYICPWELLYANDLMVSAESMSIEELEI